MRTIRFISLTALVLIALCGVASYFLTKGAHDPDVSAGSLFALSWIFSGLGIATAASIIGELLNSDAYGKRSLIGELFGFLALAFFVFAMLGGLIIGMICNHTVTAADGFTTHSHEDGAGFASMYVGFLGGLIIGFFGILVVNANESWINGG